MNDLNMKFISPSIELVTDPHGDHCVIASLAMVLEKTFDEVKVDMEELGHVIPVVSNGVVSYLVHNKIWAYPHTNFNPNAFIEDGVYLVTLVSKNHVNELHCVVLDTRNNLKLYDCANNPFTTDDWFNGNLKWVDCLALYDCK